jgi:hypothetical protein
VIDSNLQKRERALRGYPLKKSVGRRGVTSRAVEMMARI